jgi:hypothetical protein
MVRHLSSKIKSARLTIEALRGQHEEYQFLAKSEASTTKIFEPLASFQAS